MRLQKLIIHELLFHVWMSIHFNSLLADPRYEACQPKNCGDGLNISYPFYVEGAGADFCGLEGFRITCRENKTIFMTSRGPYIVKNISYENQTVRLVDLDVVNASCAVPKHYFSFDDNSPFDYSSSLANLQFFYMCNQSFSPPFETASVACVSNSSRHSFVALFPDHNFKRNRDISYSDLSCKSQVAVPVDLEGNWQFNRTIRTVNYTELLMSGFSIVWHDSYGDTCVNCKAIDGRCGFQNNQSLCFCSPDEPRHSYCSVGVVNGLSKQQKLGLGLGIGFVVLFAMMGLAIIMWCRKQKRAASRNIDDPNMNMNMEDPEGASGYLGVLVFSYKELTEATNNFDADRELGDGGFGTVYHGKLKDGREVAVKRLYEHNYKRLEQFINEIQILAGLRHKNLVSLYGCTSRRSRELLLVYEYIPNGTVADHLHGDRAKTSPLTWPIRLSVAIETARALAYLHASDIVHRDVKTNNILLDNNFCVKVADFGLSRLFPSDVTHVSTAPQGTPGYVDPEYHQCYQLTSKSDVYSFGVVLVELLSSMPAVDITRHRHEINLSNLAISKIQKQAYNELIDQDLGFDSDTRVRTMTIAVAELAFECLQQDKEMRPTMDEVLERLMRIEDGKIETKVVGGSELSMSTVLPPPPSPECDEIGLLKNIKQEQPPSPNAVTENWLSSTSTTPNFSG
ncbi:LEAF RUST 10 DISEASE-RESISTANCE LOCUS RECEPTOR-LIKE PROTEIN KINASE-like 1.2 isoform X2 [Humulus lupulus]|uniref:LEAF RUST 10 DISEASE-RESISTANCE LOCUS RECEPTOR-LIKE PROTEIN KINASE-like 1.2 isoform X2 n=1 Tax=Humulus lupulus TaxID=3486 RepID=UPI002B40FD92|nr:LEAF RUST 10 DISEASE-RESISTANCE LOCUS RECEPTOR-LIKE PROTEIN KINASE-like 1.2 isoform X2 [Humulus lupulus]